jgi:hypothetical protein
MKIGLIDVDGHNYPNLPLMKISAWHKAKGDRVRWYEPFDGWIERYDIVYQAKVFEFSRDYSEPIYARQIIKGGSGYAIELVNGKEVYHKEIDHDLPYEIEHIYPDYSLYPDLTQNTAYGFLTRGCPRGCEFCHVKCKEGIISHKVADLSEFWKGQDNIILCDPNMLACKDHLGLLRQLTDSKAKVNFNQGLDIRLINSRNLELIQQIKLDGVHFAYDRYKDKRLVESKLRAFSEATGYDRNNGRATVYILTNFNTTIQQDLERMEFCRSLNFIPYPMIYDKKHSKNIYLKLQRYGQAKYFYKYNSFDQYLKSEYKTKVTY